MEKLRKIYLLFIILFIGTIVPLTPLMAQTTPQNTPSSCTNNCNDVKCVIGTTGGHLNVIASKNQMNSQCMAKEAAKGCFNTVPVSCAGSYAGLGYRPNGAGGNPKPRNHLGSDIGMAACKKNDRYVPVNAYAAADGVVKYVNTGGCSGRTIVIEHTKACQNARDPHYKSTYRHLLQYKVGVGQSVKKGDVIGIVGGSNAGSIGAPPCDRGDQAGWEGYSTAGCAGARSRCGTPNYAIHLHFEVEDGAASSSSSQASAARAMSPNCNNLQVLCGGCPNNAGSCGGSGGVFSDGSSASLEGGYSESYQNSANAQNNCELAKFLDSEDCTFCGIFRTLFNAASAVAKTANDGFSGPCKTLVGVGFLIWLCIYVLKQIANFGGTATGDMLKGILFQGFRVAVIILILSNAIYETMDLTLTPVMQTGLSFVNSLNESSKCQDGAPYLQGILGYKSGAKDGDGGLSVDLGKSILCSIKNLEDATGFMMGLGKYSICLGTKEYRWLADILPHFGYLLTGVFLWLAGLFVLLSFPWCLVDCMLQLCVAAGLVPCAIASYAFKITEKYLKIVWNFFMNAMFNFVFLGVIIYVINSHLKDWIGMDIDDTSTFPNHVFVEGFTARGLAVWGIGFLKIAAICFFCNTFFEEAGDMAKKFAESPGIGGRHGIGRMVGGTLANAGQVAGGGALKLTAKAGRGLGHATNSLVGNKFRSGMNHAKGWVLGRLPASKIRDANGKVIGKKSNIIRDQATGKVIGYEKNFRLFGRNYNLKASKDESGVWSSDKTVQKRSAFNKAFEKVVDRNGNAVLDANGNEVYRYRKRIFGITTGYEKMSASKDAMGNTVYKSASGKGKFAMDADGKISEYKTRMTVNLDNLSTRKLSKVLDKDGNAVKDENGNDQYELKHKFLGLTFKKEEMQALKNENGEVILDEEGNIAYASKDKRNSFVMNKNGEMSNITIDKPSRTRRGENQVKQYNATRVINDGLAKTTQTLDAQGNVIGVETHFSNESAKFLNNKDGTINTTAFNQIKNGTRDAEVAAVAMVAEVMKFRGLKLDAMFKNRTQEIQEDGSIIIKQINNDGSTQQIHAQIIGNQMIIRDTTIDSKGNTTVQKSNGMQTLTEKYTRVVNEATGDSAYIYQSRVDFSDYLHQKNSHLDPLNAHGEWGHNLDPQKVMLGFTDNDFRKHLAQIQLTKMRRQMGEKKYNEAFNNKYSEVHKLSALINSGDIDTQNQLRQMRRMMGEEKYDKALKDKSSDVYKLNQKLIANSLSESAARIHAGQAMAGGLALQLSNVDSLLSGKENTLNKINAGKQKVTQAEKAALQKEIENLKIVQSDLKKAMGIEEVQQPETPTTTAPETTTPETTTPETVVPNTQQPPRPENMSREGIIDEITKTDMTPQRLTEIQNHLDQTALRDRDQDYMFVREELGAKAKETIMTLAAASLANTTPEDLKNIETMMDTFLGHTVNKYGYKTYDSSDTIASTAANRLLREIGTQRELLAIAGINVDSTRNLAEEGRQFNLEAEDYKKVIQTDEHWNKAYGATFDTEKEKLKANNEQIYNDIILQKKPTDTWTQQEKDFFKQWQNIEDRRIVARDNYLRDVLDRKEYDNFYTVESARQKDDTVATVISAQTRLYGSGNAEIDRSVNEFEEFNRETMKTGIALKASGSQIIDQADKINTTRYNNLKANDYYGKMLGMSGREYKTVNEVSRSWDQQYGQTYRQQYEELENQNSRLRPYLHGYEYMERQGLPKLSQQDREVINQINNWKATEILARQQYVKENFNEQTYENYLRREEDKINWAHTQEREHMSKDERLAMQNIVATQVKTEAQRPTQQEMPTRTDEPVISRETKPQEELQRTSATDKPRAETPKAAEDARIEDDKQRTGDTVKQTGEKPVAEDIRTQGERQRTDEVVKPREEEQPRTSEVEKPREEKPVATEDARTQDEQQRTADTARQKEEEQQRASEAENPKEAEEARQREEKQKADEEARLQEEKQRADEIAKQTEEKTQQERAQKEAEERAEIDKQSATEAVTRADDRTISAGSSEIVVSERYQEAVQYYQQAAEQYQEASRHEKELVQHYEDAANEYQNAAKYEEIAEKERQLATQNDSGADAHIRAAQEAEERAEAARQAAMQAEQRAAQEQQAIQEAREKADAAYNEALKAEQRAIQEQKEAQERLDSAKQGERTETERPRDTAEKGEAQHRNDAPDKRSETPTNARDEEMSKQKADEEYKRKADEDARTEEQRKAEEKQIADQKRAEQKRRNDEIKASESEMNRKIKDPENDLKMINYQIGNKRAELSTAQKDLTLPGLTEAEKNQKRNVYNKILAELNQMRDARKSAESAIRAARDEHAQHVAEIKKG